MASGHVNRTKRPDTWLHRPMLQNVKKALANPEPSTHDPLQMSDLKRWRTLYGSTAVLKSTRDCTMLGWSMSRVGLIDISTDSNFHEPRSSSCSDTISNVGYAEGRWTIF
jgi:hypothetical protein